MMHRLRQLYLLLILPVLLVTVSGCMHVPSLNNYPQYRHAETISFINDYPRLVHEGAITHFDSVAIESEPIVVFVYKPSSKQMYRLDEPLSKAVGEILRRDLKEGEFHVDSKEARAFGREMNRMRQQKLEGDSPHH